VPLGLISPLGPFKIWGSSWGVVGLGIVFLWEPPFGDVGPRELGGARVNFILRGFKEGVFVGGPFSILFSCQGISRF